jgi:hypothetical protein
VGIDECVVCEAEEYGCVLETKGRENIEVLSSTFLIALHYSSQEELDIAMRWWMCHK